jgi:hypothetical protein
MFDVRWGMGISDVRQRYPDLRGQPQHRSSKERTFRATGKVHGLRTGFVFTFFEGRLARLMLFAAAIDADGQLDDGLERAWCDKARTSLIKQYGEPQVDPAWRDMASTWKREDTTIWFVHPTDNDSACPLTYRQDSVDGAMRDARKALEAVTEEAERHRF